MLTAVSSAGAWAQLSLIQDTAVCVRLLAFFLPGVDTAVSSAGQYYQLTAVSSAGVEGQIDSHFVFGLCL